MPLHPLQSLHPSLQPPSSPPPFSPQNLDCASGLVNGARGVVVGFSSPSDPSAGPFRHLAAALGSSGRWPLVHFASATSSAPSPTSTPPHGMRIGPQTWTVEDSSGKAVAKRHQVPLALAWALSVHKCQGMTLDRVQTDLSRAFDCGMVYVALSRVRSLEGLMLTGFEPSRIRVSAQGPSFEAPQKWCVWRCRGCSCWGG